MHKKVSHEAEIGPGRVAQLVNLTVGIREQAAHRRARGHVECLLREAEFFQAQAEEQGCGQGDGGQLTTQRHLDSRHGVAPRAGRGVGAGRWVYNRRWAAGENEILDKYGPPNLL